MAPILGVADRSDRGLADGATVEGRPEDVGPRRLRRETRNKRPKGGKVQRTGKEMEGEGSKNHTGDLH